MSKTQDYPEILTLTLQAIIILIALPLTRSQLDWIDLYLLIMVWYNLSLAIFLHTNGFEVLIMHIHLKDNGIFIDWFTKTAKIFKALCILEKHIFFIVSRDLHGKNLNFCPSSLLKNKFKKKGLHKVKF